METFLRWPHFVRFLQIITWTTITDVSGQKYYINLYGPNSFEGTIEFSDGLSWFILHHQGWNDKNAEVTCRMLGYSGSEASATFGSSLHNLLRPVWEFQFHCNGNETSLSECKTTRLNSTTDNTSVGVKCPSHPAFEYDDFLLRSTSDNKISKVNMITMSGTVNTDTSSFTDVPGEVVYDPMYDRIVYFKDSSLWGCSFGGGKTELFRFASPDQVSQIALDNEDGLLFFFSSGAIWTLNLKDTSPKIGFVLNSTSVRTIALDHENKEIYWLNIDWKKIERAHYNGTSRRHFAFMSNFGSITSIAISGNVVYWIDTRSSGISSKLVNGTSINDQLYIGVELCSTIYVPGDWIYCVTGNGVVRLGKHGECGGYYGPFHEASQRIIQYNNGPNTSKEPGCQNFYINLFGLKPNEGTVELSNGIDWLILCDDGWNDNNAAVACRMLGYTGDHARAWFNISFPGFANTIWPYQFQCKGDEDVLSQCKTNRTTSTHCRRAGIRCSGQKVFPDFFLKKTQKGLAMTNPSTMSGYVNLNNPCNSELDRDVLYDSVHDQFLSFQSESLWGCRFGDKKIQIRTNVTPLNYAALDSEDRLLFGYLDNDIVSLRIDDAAAKFVVIVNGTSVGMKLVLDTERNDIYWWRPYFHNVIKRISYNGGSEIDVWRTSSYFERFTFKGDNIFCIDQHYRGITRITYNSTVPKFLYYQLGIMTDCTNLYAAHEWIYCTGYKSRGILRLQKDGKGGSFYGPLEISKSAFLSDIVYHHSPGSICKTLLQNIIIHFNFLNEFFK